MYIGKIICVLHNHYNNHKFEVYYFSELSRANYNGQMAKWALCFWAI